MAYSNPYTDPYADDEDELRRLNGTNTPPPPVTGGNTGIAPMTPPPTAFNAQLRDKVVQGWANSGTAFANTRQGIKGYLASLGGDGQGWRVDRDDKVYDPGGRVYDWIGNVNTADAQKRTGYTTDSRYAAVTGSKPGGKTPPKTPPTGPPIVSHPGGGKLGGGSVALPVVPGVGGSVAPIQDPRIAALYQTLLERSQQGLDVNRDNPVIRQQADAFSAQQTRAQRDYIADLAEKAGPNANLRGEQRMAAERAGQASGSFEADLMGRELTAKRDEIQNALSSMQGLLTTEQTLALQKELAVMDDAIKRLSLKQQNDQFGRSLDQQKREFAETMKFRYADLSQQQKQFMQDLGFRWNGRQWDMDPANPKNRL